MEEEKKEIVPVGEKSIEETKEIDAEDLFECFEKGFSDDKMFYAIELMNSLKGYVTNQELKKGVKLKFLTNWVRTGVWKKGQNPKYSFIVIVEEKEIRRWDTDLKLLTFLVPFMQKEGIKDLRGLTLFVQKKRDERERVYYEFEVLDLKE